MKEEVMEDTFKLSNKVQHLSAISLSVHNVGRQKCTPGYSWGPGIRDHYLIHYISSGSGTYRTGGKTYVLQAGDAFLAYPDTEICYQASEEDPWTYEWVGFSGSDAAPMISSTDFSRTVPVVHSIICGDALRHQLSRINAAFGNTFQNAVQMTGELYLLFSILIRYATLTPSEKSSDTENVNQAVTYIASRYSYAITVEDIAAFVGVSRSTLFRQFRRVRQLSPKEYLDRYRNRRAIQLLKQTDLPVASVAASVGYEDPLYFSRVFKKLMGISPSQFRAKSRDGEEIAHRQGKSIEEKP
jgi:AraC-like DNA-binding protein